MTRITYIVLRTCYVGFSRVAAWHYVGAHAAIGRSSAGLCNAENIHEWACNLSHSIGYRYRLLKRYTCSQASANTNVLLGQVSHFVRRHHLKEMCCKCITCCTLAKIDTCSDVSMANCYLHQWRSDSLTKVAVGYWNVLASVQQVIGGQVVHGNPT